MRWRQRKKEALNTFETVTKEHLQDEIEHGHREKIAELEHEYEDVKRQLQLTTAEVKARRLTLRTSMEVIWAKNFWIRSSCRI